MSRVDDTKGEKTGYGTYVSLSYKPSDNFMYMSTYSAYNDKLDFNDMGYMARNNWSEGFVSGEWRQTDFPENSRTASVTWSLRLVRSNTYNGVRLPSSFVFGRMQKMRSGSDIQAQINCFFPGYDDLLSRGNGLVYLNRRLNSNVSYSTPRRGAWRKSLNLKIFQEGYDDWGIGLDSSLSFYPHENVTVDFNLKPLWSRDWLIWMKGNQLASFSRRQVSTDIGMTWFPAERNELRLRAQCVVINADLEQAFRIGPNARLVPGNDIINDFAAINFGLQFRYKYEIAPMSEFYLVYSRGGLDRLDKPDESTLGLLSSSVSLRTSDQILAKLRYRF
jgi:hypothetical protein